MPKIDVLLHHALQMEASDLHLRVNMRPRLRVNNNLEEVREFKALSRRAIERAMDEILTAEQSEHYRAGREVDFGYGNARTGRFRCNYFLDHRGPAAVFRRIPSTIPTLEALNLPAELERFAHLSRGLVLVTGSSGSGKTSTLAALIDIVNATYHKHVITLEDPIEFIHPPKMAVIHQRGMHDDITDFESGIVDAMRQDPDVVMIGELRDLESIRQSLVAADLGILVFATLHTNSAADSIDRIIDVFPPYEQPQARAQLSQRLAGIVSQCLLRRIDRDGLVPATEVLVGTPAVGAIIREGKTQEIQNFIQSGKERGMHSLDDSLQRLVRRKIVDPKEAAPHARHKARFEHHDSPTMREPTPA